MSQKFGTEHARHRCTARGVPLEHASILTSLSPAHCLPWGLSGSVPDAAHRHE